MIDLHTHSTCSDGSESPARVVEQAVASGCSAVALTDHDNLDGLAEARASAGTLGIRLVPGCEVSCSTPAGTMHLLCYFIEEGDGPLQYELTSLQRDRERRNEAMAERLADLGLPITYDEVLAEAGGTGVGRPHFAAVLMRHGLASSVNDAFQRYLAKGRPGYVPKTRVQAPEIIELCRRSGGCAVLAHPLSLELDGDDLRRRLAELATAGLVGLECYYGRYQPDERRHLAELASDLGLVATGGSDYHGRYKPDLEVGTGHGDLEVPESALTQLDERRPALP